ncbi:hypothetical protein [Georgenia sp. AZ-5]|uniref:hypothetical protein n=1 Tax=Georgenia sp. AZ-5 TaxID=3367526 RepID=UPI0037542002
MTEPRTAAAYPERAAAGRAGAAPLGPAVRLGRVTTTTLVHKHSRAPEPWWHHAAVYQLREPLDLAGAQTLAAEISHVSSLGADAVQVRCPDLDPAAADAGEVLGALVHRAHQRSLRLVVEVAGSDAPPGVSDTAAWHRGRVADWLRLGADGVDLSVAGPVEPGPHVHPDIDLGALQVMVAEQERDAVLTGAASAMDLESLSAHLHEDWPHVARDDRLVTTPWRAADLRAAITDAYVRRDPLGAAAGWAMPRAREGSGPPAWASPSREVLRARLRAATLLMLALPGCVYLRHGEEVELVPRGGVAESVPEVTARAREQRGQAGSTFERYRLAMRLRHELRLGTGPLAWIDDAPPGTLALVNRHVMVLVNVAAEAVTIPPEREVLHTSGDLLGPADGGLTVPPDTTVWVALE